jgi:hypothetical protein
VSDDEPTTIPGTPNALGRYGPMALRNVWGVDTDWPMTDATISALASARIPANLDPAEPSIVFVLGYVGLGPNGPNDLTAARVAALTARHFAVLAVQHCREGAWDASGARGAVDGQWAAKNALAAGLVPGLGIGVGLDLEDVSQATWGQPTLDHVFEWAAPVFAAGFEPWVYHGFNCGLTPAQLYSVRNVRRYGAAPGQPPVATRGDCFRQHGTIRIGGVEVDPDYCSPDALGGCLVGMVDTLAAVA